MVSHKTLGIISPRPLKRVISTPPEDWVLPCCFRIFKRGRVRRRPSGFVCRCRCGRGGQGDEDLAGVDEGLGVSVEEGQEEGGDVVAVGVRVGEEDDLGVAQF